MYFSTSSYLHESDFEILEGTGMNSQCRSMFYWFTAAFLIFSGCHGAPSWVYHTPEDDRYYYGRGNSSTMEDAEEKARADLIRAIEVKVESEITSIETSKGAGRNEDVRTEFIARSRSYATQELRNLQIVERYPGETEYYALARLERKVVIELLKAAGEDYLEDVKDRIKHGDTTLDEGNIIDADQEYKEALKIADILPRSYRRTPEDYSDGTTWKVVIDRKLKYIYDNVHIEMVSGNEQTGQYGKPLAAPLIVRLRCADVSLNNFSLKATYTRGTGRLKNNRGEMGESVRIYTNADGEGKCWVDAVESISPENYIWIIPDEGSISLPESTAVAFRYRSVFPKGNEANAPQVFLNGSSREQEIPEGSSFDIEIHLTDNCFIHLFEITADGNLTYRRSTNEINGIDSGKRWSVVEPKKSSNPVKWVFKIESLPVKINTGLDLETILVITTMVEWEPTRKTLTTEGLIRQLNEVNEVDENNWSADSVSYRIVPTIQ